MSPHHPNKTDSILIIEYIICYLVHHKPGREIDMWFICLRNGCTITGRLTVTSKLNRKFRDSVLDFIVCTNLVLHRKECLSMLNTLTLI